jgi:hypothetical protein
MALGAALDPFLTVPAIAIGVMQKRWYLAVAWGAGFGLAFALITASVFDQWDHPYAGKMLGARLLACILVTLAAFGVKRLFRAKREVTGDGSMGDLGKPEDHIG